jgi:outer membrane lipoprotein carrier protein
MPAAAAKSWPARKANDGANAAGVLRSLSQPPACSWPRLANAGAIDKLHQFLESTRTVRADFAQTVVARNGRQGQVSSGVMIISRPGKFRWQIDKPYSAAARRRRREESGSMTRICARSRSGKRVPSAERRRHCSLATAAIEKTSACAKPASATGLEWVEAIPKAQDSGFEKVRLGFAGNELRAMESCSTASARPPRWSFRRYRTQPATGSSLFRFTPPANTDVIGE